MTLTVTFENVRYLFMEKHSMPPDFKLKIQMPKKSRVNPAMDQFKKFKAQYPDGVPADRKIEAIKFLREMVPGMGLAQAKFNVETNFELLYNFINQNKTWCSY